MEVALPYEGDDCLPWPFSMRGGRRPQDAYPAITGGYGHGYLCELAHGPKPTPAHEVEHRCASHRCMNKRHLWWATHKENCGARLAQGRQPIGEGHGRVVLTEPDVAEIRSTPKVRGSGIRLAEKYGVSPALVSLIRNGRIWRHSLEAAA